MARRKFTVFSLSFLDCICCGFGAVILLFVLMSARSSQVREDKVKDLRGEVSLVEVEILNMEREKVLARNALDEIVEELAETQGLSRELLAAMEESREELARFEGETLATVEHVNQLKTDLLSLEQGLKRLEAGAASETPGENLRAFAGDGRRQYLTGLQLRGERTLILVDVSASFLAETVVDVLRIRNLPREEQKEAPKWVQARRTVEWLLAKLPPEGQFHIAFYSERTRPALEAPGWWDAADPAIREAVALTLPDTVPAGPTSLHNALSYARTLSPPPDNIILLADGLPTMDQTPPTLRRAVPGRRRIQIFNEAVRLIPDGANVNVLLFPMEGDPAAAIAYWRLAVDTRGSFLTVAEDWP